MLPTWSSSHTDDSGELLALRIIKLLNHDAVVAKLQKALYPCDLADLADLADKIDSLNAHIKNLTKQVKAKDIELEKKIYAYTRRKQRQPRTIHRRPNLQIHEVPEANSA